MVQSTPPAAVSSSRAVPAAPSGVVPGPVAAPLGSLVPGPVAAQVGGPLPQSLVERAAAAAVRLAVGVVFLVVAYVAVRLVLRGVRSVAVARGREEVAGLAVAVAAAFLWFAIALVFLSIVGLEDIAASLGTATGFVALGVAYALSEMLADTVAGVYLLRDADFEVGDRVAAVDATGTVEAVDLRKSRFRLDDGNLLVVANQEVEKRWTKVVADGEGGEDGEDEGAESEGEEGSEDGGGGAEGGSEGGGREDEAVDDAGGRGRG